MDFQNLCQRLDLENLRAKIPPLPGLPPALKQIKLPKLKSRKIFRSSREDINSGSNKNSSPSSVAVAGGAANSASSTNQRQLSLLPPPPPSDFIKQTPTRISTISSLMHQETLEYYTSTNTYQSAGRIDDDYSSPTQYQRPNPVALARPISPIKVPSVAGGNDSASASGSSKQNMSFGQKLQKGYKDFSAFKFKHIFAKKTVVRKDNIEVAHYVQRYNEDLAVEEEEQQKRDAEIAENYRIHFTLSRQNTVNSKESEEEPSPSRKFPEGKKPKSVPELSGDESGMEATPPARKPGIAATRFSRVRHPPVDMSLDNTFEEQEAAKENEEKQNRDKVPASTKLKDRMRSLKVKYMPSQEKSSSNKDSTDKAKPAHSSPQNSDEESSGKKKEDKPATPEGHFKALKTNFKRLQKSIKRSAPPESTGSTDESGDEESLNLKEKVQIKALKLQARLKKFRSTDDLDDGHPSRSDNDGTPKSPSRSSAFTSKLQTWKKSFKRQASEGDMQRTGDESSPEKRKRSDTLIKKLKHIRARKNPQSNEELDDGANSDPGSSAKPPESSKFRNIEERFQQARQRTLKRVNDKMQQMNIFQKNTPDSTNKGNKTDSDSEKEDSSLSVARRGVRRDCEEEDIEEIQNLQKPFTKWTSKPIHRDSLDTDDPDAEFPRVLIHQDNTDVFESTLIIAVTRSPSVAATSPIITEIVETPKKKDWVPNQEIIKGFRALTPSDFTNDQKPSLKSFSDSDSWIPERSQLHPMPSHGQKKRSSAGELSEAPWKVTAQPNPEEKLYKTKSIDIFEVSKSSLMTAFDNFDEELRNEPILKIVNNVDGYERESSEDPDAPDDDNSSRVTKISLKPCDKNKNQVTTPCSTKADSKPSLPKPSLRQIGNSQESLIAQKGESGEQDVDSDEDLLADNFIEDEDDHEDDDDEEDDDRPPSAPPSPPPSMSPPPPPLPERKAAIRTSLRLTKQKERPLTPSPSPPPPLPFSKPPLPSNKPQRPSTIQLQQQQPQVLPKIPERSASMNRISKPLVKTSSLRLAYNEQPQPNTEQKQRPPKIINRRRPSSEDYSEEDEEDDDDHFPHQKSKAFHQPLKIIEEQDPKATLPNPEILISKPPRTNKMRIPNLSLNPSNNEPYSTPSQENKTFILGSQSNNNADTDSNSDFKSPLSSSKNSLNLDSNFNYSHPNSEYGSPLTYPSSLMGSAETTPIPDRRLQQQTEEMLNGNLSRRSRRSMTRDNESFYSFDSDEENSYYSISSSTSSRYVVEL